MKTIVVFFLALISAINLFAQQTDYKGKEVVFQSVNVVPMDEEKIISKQDVVVKDGKITAIGATGKVKYAKDAIIVKANGKYLMPGLAEIHAHVPPIDDIEPMKEVLTLFLANGVTTIRGMLGHPRHLELRSKINSGEILGPHFYTTGPSINGNSVPTEEIAISKVRDQKAAGYDYLKLHPGLTVKNFDAVTKTAKEVGIPFAGHVSNQVGVWRAIDAGYSSIDHLDGFIEGLVPEDKKLSEEENGLFGIFSYDRVDRSQIPKLMKGLRDNNIWVVPTQALAERWMSPIEVSVFQNAPEMKYMKPETRANWVKSKTDLLADAEYKPEKVTEYVNFRRLLINECQKSGVGLLLGSDAPQIFNVPGFSIHHELKYLVDSGLTPYQALRTGTVNVAKYLGKSNSGSIKTGNDSDLVLLNANPLENIKNSTSIEGVMIGTNWLSKDYIAAELKKLEK